MTRLERKWSGSEEEGMGGRLTHEVAKDKEEKGVQDDSHDTPEDRHSLEVDDDAKLAQVTTFEELMRMAGTHGRWNIAIITICALGDKRTGGGLLRCALRLGNNRKHLLVGR
ncbi:hypothetical protein O3P69_005263 [Scylla paramamosain]|uniref:Uncharacterized protein n=1 Tax=Scylla paramamosain TaxID=85552 RepID=A0AAW0U8J9_SCYPA